MRLWILAGEASGDRLGADLMHALASEAPHWSGIGGDQMQQAGLRSLVPMERLSVMGLTEVLPRLPELLRLVRRCGDQIAAERPDALITIDSPDFCLRVARRARARGFDGPVIHYVAPSVWAWRPKRAARMAQVVDHVLTLLPFEPDLMRAVGMSSEYVGHPAVLAPAPDPAQVAAQKALYGPRPILLALPGSRSGEIRRLGPVFGAALAQAGLRDHQILVPAAPGQAEALRQIVARWPVPAQVVPPGPPAERRALFAAADLALAASGTVSLELAAARTPMVIAYDMAWPSGQIMRRMARIDTVTLVNLLSHTRAVPEYLLERCRPDLIASGLAALNRDRAPQLEAIDRALRALHLGPAAPGARAAASVRAVLARRA